MKEPGFLHRTLVPSLVALSLAEGILPCRALGQSVAGTILGEVTDASGAAVPGATVSVVHSATGFVRRQADLFLLPVGSPGTGVPIPFRATEAVEDTGVLSPNGRWLAYRGTDHGRFEVYVGEVLPDGRPGPGRWPISSGGGWSPRWRRDGRELLYFSGTGVMTVDVETEGAAFRCGSPRRLFDPRFPIDPGASFDVTRDGQRLLLVAPVKAREPIRVLVNWLSQGS